MFRRLGKATASGLVIAVGVSVPAWADGATERVSVGPGGAQGNRGSSEPALSADGRFVAFASDAANLVAGDTNSARDVFVRDRRTGTTRRVSIGPDGVQSNGFSADPALSPDGRFVAFESRATNLVPGDFNRVWDVFVRDRWRGQTERVSLGPRGVQGNRGSFDPALSADGRFVAFVSRASNLVPGDTNRREDVFLHDRQTGVTERVSVGPGGVQGNLESGAVTISASGRFVAFISWASNLVPGDANGLPDVFVHDSQTGVTERVSLGPGGVEGNAESRTPALSADGRFVAFASDATNLVAGDTNLDSDVFVRDRQTGVTRRVSLGPGGVQSNGFSFEPALSPDGRFVAFVANASNLVPGDTNDTWDVFVRDHRQGRTERVSVGPGGAQGDLDSSEPAVSADGRFVAFHSVAGNLVPGDTNLVPDVFVRRRW